MAIYVIEFFMQSRRKGSGVKRRDILRWTGAAGGLAVAGCVAEDGGDSEGGDDSTPEGTPEAENDDGDSGDGDSATDIDEEETPTETDEKDESNSSRGDMDSKTVVETFVTAWHEGDVETANELLSDEGNLEPISEDDAEEMSDPGPELEEIEATARDEDGASVEALLLLPETEESVSYTFVLDKSDGDWYIEDLLMTGQQRAPKASFDTEHDESELIVMHEGGEPISADELFIEGEGIDETGAWHELSEELEPGDDVSAGDRVRVGVENEYDVTLVWDDGEYSVSLLSMGGASESDSEGNSGGESDSGSSSDSGSESESDDPVDEHLAETENYDGTVEDFTGEDEVTVQVASEDEPQFVFDPPAIRIDAGTTVIWEWSGQAGAHNVVEVDGAFGSEIYDEAGTTFSHTFEESGTYLYICEPHAALGQNGAIVVE